jgi:hypothetical protein
MLPTDIQNLILNLVSQAHEEEEQARLHAVVTGINFILGNHVLHDYENSGTDDSDYYFLP